MFKLTTEGEDIVSIRNEVGIKSLGSIKDFPKQETLAPVTIATDNEKNVKKSIQLNNLLEGTQLIDSLHLKATQISPCKRGVCSGSIYMPDTRDVSPGELRTSIELKKDATKFYNEYFQSLKNVDAEEHCRRLKGVFKEIDETGTYDLTENELEFGAHLAWRNAPRCSGRIQWKKLKVFDCRHVKTPKEMFEALLEHIEYATNGGNIRSTVTVFPHKRERMSEFRIWNSQLIRYAGYKQPDGSIIGDPINIGFTEICELMGWEGKRTKFDVLPLILQAPGHPPEFFPIPQEHVLEINIKHPNFPKLEELGLKWYGVPAVANMMFDCGGLQFTACPFNGWYNATEIGARNLVDKSRYNLLKPLAEAFGYDTSNLSTLWKDRAMVEVTYAVINSYQEAGITIVDHHNGAEQFMKHIKDEEKSRGGCPTDWVWVVPPISGGLTEMFHQEFLNYNLRPSYEYQVDPWKYLPDAKKIFKKSSRKRKSFKSVGVAVIFASSLMSRAMKQRKKATILYASETGRSETFSNTLKDLFLYMFNPRVICMDDYDVTELTNEECLMIVASTFGNGDSPDNGKEFEEKIHHMVEDLKKNHQITNNDTKPLSNLRYSVFALGSKAYPNFCAFGHLMNKMLKLLGGEEIQAIGEGDELCGQDESFQTWASNAFKSACGTFRMKDISMENAIQSMTDSHLDWKKESFRLIKSQDHFNDLCKALSMLHNKNVIPAKCISVQNLQANDSGRVTNLVKIDRNSGDDKITFQPGDHLTVFPSNEESSVNGLLQLIESDQDVDESVMMEHKEDDIWMRTNKISFGCSIREMFTHFLDITTPPSQKLLLILAAQCANKAEEEILLQLAENNSKYDHWAHEDYPNVVEVLQQFPSIKCDVTLLIHHLPVLKPRYYSISSSPNLHRNEVHITTSLVYYQVKNDNEHHGVCSQFLHNIKPGGLIPCYIKSAPSFHLSLTSSTPIIMIGPGTGIAPFRSFWQEAIHDKNEQNKSAENDVRKMLLYFGCRNSSDDIYREELVQAKEIGALTNVHTAYSREPGMKKVYVQHLLQNHGREIGELVTQDKADIYVCGDVMMAADVWKTFVEIVKEYCSLSNEEAQEYISNLRETGRYHEDIFGTLSFQRPLMK